MDKLLKQRVEIIAQEVEKMKAGGAGEGYTKTEADAKFLSKSDASSTYATKSNTYTKSQADNKFQPIIEDLSSIRTGAASGATALPALIEQVDNGAKNLINSVIKSQVITEDGANITISVNADKSFSFNGTTGNTDIFVTIEESNTIPAGNYIFSGIADNAQSDYDLYIAKGSTYECIIHNTRITSEFNPIVTEEHTIALRLTANKTYTNQTVKPMLCTLADWNASQKYVPGRPSYDIVSKLAQNGGFIDSTLGGIIANADLNLISKSTFAVYNEPTNLPSGISGYCYVRTSVYDDNSALQELYVIQSNPVAYFRIKLNNSWTGWVQTSNV